ncbi:MAG: hypothetical protein KDK70_02500 [Myxococcales bacterium]|nr:hypothetical protein [Myxococcales bacterium]
MDPKQSTLTPRPRAPALVRATAIGTLALASLGCGDDQSGTSTVADSDQFPTAGPCAHSPDSPECASTGQTSLSGTDASTSTGLDDSATDVFPTAGPCAHDPNSPGCASSSGSDGSGSDSTGSTGSTGTGSSSGG